jgi:hypothetical protein
MIAFPLVPSSSCPSYPSSCLGTHPPVADSASLQHVSMTRSRYRIFETEYPYFLTSTLVGWLPVFTRPEAANIVYDPWRHLQ